MKEKIRNLFDEMKVRSRYKSMSDIINMIEPIVNQEVEKRIKERQLSNNEIKSSALKLGHEWLMISGEIIAFIRGAEWYRSFMTQKTEGGEG